MSETKTPSCLTTIIPAYNEGDTIGITITQLLKSLEKQPYPYEVIVVDDGSLDGTGIIAKEQGADIVIRNSNNKGKGAAIASGVAQASGSIIVLMDADGTYNPDDITRLISPILGGYADMVVASRLHMERAYTLHTIGNYIISLVNKALFGIKTSDVWSGFKAFRLEEFKEFMEKQYVVNDFDLELLNFANRKGYRIVEMPLKTRLRKSVGYSKSKSKLFSFKMGFRILLRILKTRERKKN